MRGAKRTFAELERETKGGQSGPGVEAPADVPADVPVEGPVGAPSLAKRDPAPPTEDPPLAPGGARASVAGGIAPGEPGGSGPGGTSPPPPGERAADAVEAHSTDPRAGG